MLNLNNNLIFKDVIVFLRTPIVTIHSFYVKLNLNFTLFVADYIFNIPCKLSK